MQNIFGRFIWYGNLSEMDGFIPETPVAFFFDVGINGKWYGWNGSVWVSLTGSGTGGMEIHGNEFHTPDFLTANAPITPAAKTKITYDANGLVTSGQDATAADVGAEPAGTVATHASAATAVHGVGASSVESIAGSASKVSTHAGVTSSVHGFDSAGKAPPQSHGNTAHSSTFVVQGDIDASITAHSGASDPHTVYQKESEKGAISGYAPLDAASKVPTANLGGAGASGSNYLRGDQTWATPAGGSGELWEGKVHVAMFNGNPMAEPFQALSNNTTLSPVVTPTNIGVAVGRLVAFRFKTAITVATIRWYGIAAVAAIYTAAIYRDSDGARLWSPTNVDTLANAWSNSVAGLPITLNADTLYWFGIGADTTGTTGGFITPQFPKAASFGLATPAWAGMTTMGLRFCQVTLSAGVWPATLPAKVNAGAWTGFIPVFYLCAAGQ